jgi:hypothetical protein
MPFDAAPDAEVTARDRMIRLRDFLAELDYARFNMNYWRGDPAAYPMPDRHTCGTACCIGGWAQKLYLPEYVGEHVEAAGECIGLTRSQAAALFYPSGIDVAYDDITLPHAVAVLDHYLETGDIDWAVATP